MTRICANPECGQELVRRKDESEIQLLDRKCCSHQCHVVTVRLKSLQEIAQMAPRYCALDGCGATLVAIPGERHYRFRQRRFCNKRCAGLYSARLGRAGKTAAAPAEPDELRTRSYVYPVGYRYQDRPGLDGWSG